MEVGDVVRLKSGGPRMTIVSIDLVFATCWWFPVYGAEDAQPRAMTVRLSALEEETEDEVVQEKF